MQQNSSILHADTLTTVSLYGMGPDSLKLLLMKRIAWLILICYSITLLKPALPVFADVLAHTFWEQQHLMTVHEEHGKFHIHYEVEQTQQNSKGKSAGNYKYTSDETITVTGELSLVPPVTGFGKRIYRDHMCHYPVHFHYNDYIPPRA
jgi:hypothetical protein